MMMATSTGVWVDGFGVRDQNVLETTEKRFNSKSIYSFGKAHLEALGLAKLLHRHVVSVFLKSGADYCMLVGYTFNCIQLTNSKI